MNVLIVNPILYTSETHRIKKADTIKDTMIYDLCLAFNEKGMNVTLAAAEDFKPEKEEEYPFNVIWMKTKLSKLLPANTIPYCPSIKSIIKNNNYELIISSEVFSINSLILARKTPQNLIIWHELAKHNKIFNGYASKFWYNVIAKNLFKNAAVVARSIEAKDFISHYCPIVSEKIIDHGVNLNKFTAKSEKENYFIVSSQLIKRKRIDGIIKNFSDYLMKYDNSCKLYILGEGEERENLELLTKTLGIEKNVTFKGKLSHDKLKNYLASAKALLVNTEKDNNMVSIVEAIACATPIITTSIPYNASYIKANGLGIARDNWDCEDMHKVAENSKYIENCFSYRDSLSCANRVDMFINISQELHQIS